MQLSLDRIFPKFLRNKWTHSVCCVSIVFILSLIPQENLPKSPFSYTDLIVHFTMYGGLAYCISLSIFDSILQNRYSNIEFKIPIILGILGLFIEFLQKSLPIHRHFSWEDACSNFLGACSFYFIVLKLRKMSS